MSERLRILEGLFFERDGEIVFQSPDGTSLSIDTLTSFQGGEVEVSIHHLPPVPPVPHADGFGCCMWGGHCPHGHKSDPTWLYNQTLKGVLRRLPTGTWMVGEERLPVEFLVGHLGRLVCFAEGIPDSSADLNKLLEEAQALIGQLSALKNRGTE